MRDTLAPPAEPAAADAIAPPPAGSETLAVDFLVIGSGLAGIYSALQAARHGRCLLITKARLHLSNSAWAQGGIAVALDADDDPALHVGDTLRAGRGLCKESAVEILAREGPSRVQQLLDLGVPFVLDEAGRPDLGLEGGHGRRRIVHANGGATGQAVVDALLPRVAAEPNILVWEGVRATALLTCDGECLGALCEGEGWRSRVRARATILATGGACGLYARTTNPPTTTGDGIALAYAAGAAVADMEFVQFHPTAFALGRPAFLLSEALRGEGAQLFNTTGERFMRRYDPAEELAPRDVVSRAVVAEMAATGADHVQLRLDHIPAAALSHFSRLFDGLRARGFDPQAQPIPVAPAAHFLMGGVKVDADGRTTLRRLFACGEVSCTGVHGANRLASNSLLECLVFGYRAVAAAAASPANRATLPEATPLESLSPQQRRSLGERMFSEAGIVRDAAALDRLAEHLRTLPASTERIVAELIIAGAIARQESRGSHFRSDYPDEDAALRRHFVAVAGGPTEAEVWS